MKMEGCYCYTICLDVPGKGERVEYPAANSQQEAIDKALAGYPAGTRVSQVTNDDTGKTWYPLKLTKKNNFSLKE